MSDDTNQVPVSAPAFVGRADELTRLRDLADMAVEHGAQMVVLSGEAGIGKSTLTSELLRQLSRDGWGAHVGHCIEYADRPLPFAPVVGLLRSVLLDNLEQVDLIVGHHREDLATLLPELTGDQPQVQSLAGDVDRLFDAIATTLANAARRRPLAVVVEDIHWADAATRDLMASLVHSLGTARVLLLVTERSGALSRSHPLRTWLAEQRRFANVHSLELEGLSKDEFVEQAMSILGERPDRRLVDRLFERTGGNPYFAHELLLAERTQSGELPRSLIDFLAGRLERLSSDELAVLKAIAVAGGVVSHQRLEAMVPDIDVRSTLRTLFDASIIHVDGSDYSFGHALVREAILADLLPFELEELHRRAAEVIEATLDGEPTLSDAVGLALHWARANDPVHSLTTAVRAAYAAAVVAAYDAASDMGLQALQQWPLVGDAQAMTQVQRDQLVVDTAEWLASCYRGPEAVELVEGALDDWARDLPAGKRALLMATVVPIHFALGNPGDARTAIATAEELVRDEVSAEAAQVHYRACHLALQDGQIHPARRAAERAIAIAAAEGPRLVLVEAMITEALAVGIVEDLDAGLELVREARALAEEAVLVSQVARAYRTEMLILNYREGRTAECLQALVDGLAFAEKHCGPRTRQDFRVHLALGYTEAGQLLEAGPLLDRLLSDDVDDLRRLTALQTAALRALAMGSLGDAARYLAEATEVADRYESAQETGVQARLLAELARREGRLAEALELIDRAIELQLESDNVTYTRESILEKARIVRALADAGDHDADAEADTRRLIEQFDAPGRANRALASLMELELAAMGGSIDGDAARATVAQLEDAGFAYEAAQARLIVIDELVRTGADRTQLETDMVRVLEAATSNGLQWVAERVRAYGRIARVSLEPAPVTASTPERAELPHQLTAREVEVMSLLAEGLTNKEIGERLFVSPRTISTHISNLLAKLGVKNRGEAAAAYHRLGLDRMIDVREPAEVD